MGSSPVLGGLGAPSRSRSAAFVSPQFQTLEQERETRLVSNYALAKENLSLRPRLEDGKAALAIKYQELREIREACWDKQQRLGTYAATRSPQGALGRLQAELEAAEAESEAQMERFLSQELPLDAFLESFRRSRAQSHLRRARVEKLQDLLRAERLRGAPGAPTPAPPHCGAAPGALPLRLGLTPALPGPLEAALPFPVPAAPPSRRLPALGTPPPAGPGPRSPRRLAAHVALLSPRPFRVQRLPRREPPHR